MLANCARQPAPSDSPTTSNVIFILADDLGIMDINAYANHYTGLPADSLFYRTPHLDRLVREGVAFSQAYATQLCSPTRAGILAGKFAPRLGFMTAMPLRETYYNQQLPVPEGYNRHDVLDHHDDIAIARAWDNATSNSALTPEVLALPEAMPRHHAAFLGKWHIGGFGAAGVQPQDQGFEALAYYDAGASAYYNWQPSWNNKSLRRFPDMPQEEWKIGKAGPPTAQEYLTDDLTQRAVDYLDTRLATPGQPFFLYLSHFAVHAPYQGKPAETEYYAQRAARGTLDHVDPAYASLLEGLDRSVGRIMDHLAATGLAKNTVIVFMSDNGGIDRDITPKGDGTDNDPFLGGKACLTEGGIRVPLIVWRPGTTGGQWVDHPVDYTDIYPTILEAGGYDATTVIDREQLDGRSVLPLLDGRAADYGEKTRFWHYPFNVIYNSPYDGFALTPHSAVRRGDYKLIFDWYGRLHLYDLVADPYEQNDLADRQLALRDELLEELLSWLQANVGKRYYPQLNPGYTPTEEARTVPFRNLLPAGFLGK